MNPNRRVHSWSCVSASKNLNPVCVSVQSPGSVFFFFFLRETSSPSSSAVWIRAEGGSCLRGPNRANGSPINWIAESLKKRWKKKKSPWSFALCLSPFGCRLVLCLFCQHFCHAQAVFCVGRLRKSASKSVGKRRKQKRFFAEIHQQSRVLQLGESGVMMTLLVGNVVLKQQTQHQSLLQICHAAKHHHGRRNKSIRNTSLFLRLERSQKTLQHSHNEQTRKKQKKL